MSIRRKLAAGLIIVLPVIVTYWVVKFLFNAVNDTVTPVLTNIIRWVAPGSWAQYAWINFVAPLVSVILAVLVIYVIGLIGGNVLGRQLLGLLESLLLRIPVVRGIYSAARQFVDTFSRPEGTAFRGVVLVEFPREGTWSLGFVTGTAPREVVAHAAEKLVSVFVPTTPNPTGGYLLFVPERNAIRLEMSVDEALKMVISGGVLSPDVGAVASTSRQSAAS
jgi:uncharacterized membrane protein